MNFNYIIFAIPFFLLLIGIEVLVDKKKKGNAFRLNDSIANLNIGIGEQIMSVFTRAFMLMLYDWVFQYRIYDMPSNFFTGLVLLFAFDFIFYWAHRFGHEINIGWGGHIVHHSSEEYNLTVALRQPWFFASMTFFMFLPLAWLGFKPELLLIVAGIDILFQFWIHTKYIGKLGFLELFLNTPSHHRVHHGRNPQYIDKNYAGMFIIWDRMFGTFEEEKEEVVYGITSPLKSWNPAWANVHYFFDLVQIGKPFSRFSDKVKLFFKHPGWKPDELGGTEFPEKVENKTYHKFDFTYNTKINSYVLVQFAILTLVVVTYLAVEKQMPFWKNACAGTYLIVTLSTMATMFENKRWTFILENIRLLLFPLVIFLLPINSTVQLVLTHVAFLSSVAFMLWNSRLITATTPQN